jgi:hypothetical protein
VSDRHRRASGTGVKHSPRRDVEEKKSRDRDRAKYNSGTSTDSTSQLLSSNALAKLDAYNARADFQEKYEAQKRKKKEYKNLKGAEAVAQRKKRKNRNVSGAILEEGRAG